MAHSGGYSIVAGWGVNTVFRLSGWRNYAGLRCIVGDGGVEHLLCRHEQGRGNGGYRLCPCYRQTGVCVATKPGPGATNLITGLADALLDSIPVVAITGQSVRTRLSALTHFRKWMSWDCR